MHDALCHHSQWYGQGLGFQRRLKTCSVYLHDVKTILHALQVGSQFVQQYYTVLHSSPRYLHRFYTDLSSMTHCDGGYDGKPGRLFTVQTQKVHRAHFLFDLPDDSLVPHVED
jgi:hypothetical protein